MTATDIRPPAKRAQQAPRGQGRSRLIVTILLLLAGVGVLVYPVAATQYNNIQQRSFADKYNNEVQQISESDLAADLESARAYNASINGVPILDPWLNLADGDPTSQAFGVYKNQLSRFDAMARIRVPSVDIDLPVYHGTSDPVLAKGAGHLYGTSLPVGGENTHAVLTSHTGMSNATLFDHLIDVKEGDLIFVDVLGETLAYKVDQIKVVLPSEIGDLTVVDGHDYLTLFTCTPYAVNSHRLLVRGERVDWTPEVAAVSESQAESVIQIEDWMWWLLGGALVGLLAVLAIIIGGRRRSKNAQGAAGRHGSKRGDKEAASLPTGHGSPSRAALPTDPAPRNRRDTPARHASPTDPESPGGPARPNGLPPSGP